MSDSSLENLPKGWKSVPSDLGSDQTAFKGVQWGKAMMWIFLLSDTFIFSCFLISYMKGRASTVVDWPNTSHVFSLDFMGVPVPLLLIAIMTFVLAKIQEKSLSFEEPRWLLARCVTGLSAMACYFYAIPLIPLTTAVVLQWTSPLFVALFSGYLIKERVSPFLFICIGVAFVGTVLIISPSFEAVDNNPYLNDFYLDMQRWSFNLQVFFLNSRFRQVKEIADSKETIIQDRTIYEDAFVFAPNLHAMGLMSSRDYENYLSLFSLMESFVKPPDLLIYLRSSVPNLVNQIQNRGRNYEESIRIDYLNRLNERYEAFFFDYKHNHVVIETDNLNYEKKDEDFQKVIQIINKNLKL